MTPQSILRRPILTEKSTHGVETRNTYVFDVARDANRIQIRTAVEELFGGTARGSPSGSGGHSGTGRRAKRPS